MPKLDTVCHREDVLNTPDARKPAEWPVYALAATAAAVLLGGTYLLASTTIDRLIRKDAETTGTLWAADFGKRMPDLDRILGGEPPSAESTRFMVNAGELGSIFRFKLFDAEGRQILVSDELGTRKHQTELLGTHNPTAAKVLASGRAHSEMKHGTTPDRPPVFVEAYVPLFTNGRLTAVTEVYIDQTEKLAVFRSHMAYATVGLVALTALAFALPAAGFLWRSRQKRSAEDRAAFLAHYDKLTGLANRSAFTAMLEAAIALRNTAGESVSLLHVDIDGFKDINDSLGHDVGDAFLQGAARRLRALCTSDDLVARLGGDEFAIVPGRKGDVAHAQRLARQVIESVATPCTARGHEIVATASVGIVVVAPGETPAPGAVLALKRADIAMHRAKADGRNRLSVFSPEMDDALQARREIERLIRKACREGGFELYFQPLFSTRGGAVTGFEALLRLPDGQGGMIPPAEFIPVAEDMALISQIGNWVLHRACEVASGWPQPLKIAVNLSPAQFADGTVVRTVREALRASGLAPGRLELEITEGLLLDRAEHVLRDLTELKSLGAAIVMDDFGTGYSSLSYLWKFPFSKIKIDRSFVSALSDADPSVGDIVRTIVGLGQQLRLEVTAEGVETETQARFLGVAQCDQLQGFLLGRPMPEHELRAWLAGGQAAAVRERAAESVPG